MKTKESDSQGFFWVPYFKPMLSSFSWLVMMASLLRSHANLLEPPDKFTAEDGADLTVANKQLEREEVKLHPIEEQEIQCRNIIFKNTGVWAALSLGAKTTVLLCWIGIVMCLGSLFGNPFNWSEENFNTTETIFASVVMAIPFLLMSFNFKTFIKLLSFRNAIPQTIAVGLSLIACSFYAYFFAEMNVYRETKTVVGFQEVVVRESYLRFFLTQIFSEIGICLSLSIAQGLALRPQEPKEVKAARQKLKTLQRLKAPIEKAIDNLLKKISMLERKKTDYESFMTELSSNQNIENE